MGKQQAQFTAISFPDLKEQSTDIKSVFNRYLYHWPLFIIGLLVCLAAALVYISVSKPQYEIRATILIDNKSKDNTQKSALQEIDILQSNKVIENEIEVLKSKKLISDVIEDLGLSVNYQEKVNLLKKQDLYKRSPVTFTLLKDERNSDDKASTENTNVTVIIKDDRSFVLKDADGEMKTTAFGKSVQSSFGVWKLEPTEHIGKFKDAEIFVSLLDPDKLALDYQASIDASLTDKLSTAIVLTLDDHIRQRGKDVLNQLIFDYNSAGKAEKNRETKKTLDFISQRLDSVSGDLNVAEKGIEGFKSSQGLTDISSESKISLENLQANDTKLNDVNVQLSVIEGIERYINSKQNAGRAPATIGIEDPALTSLIEKLSTLQLQREKMLAIMPETNPDFDPVNRQISTTKAAIKENVNNIKSSLLNTRNQLSTYNSRFESSIKNIPTQEREYISKKRQQASKESLYTYLLQKREELAVSYASNLSTDRVVDQAYAGEAKSKTSIALALALFLGIGIPAGFIYGRNSLHQQVMSREDIEDNLDGIPVISELPFEIYEKSKEAAVNSTSPVIEQFRMLRTNLYYLHDQEKKSGRVTLLTSSVPSEGKSFVSSNLTLALAYSERKTVILEMDLRKPKIAEKFNLPVTHPGLTEFLGGKAKYADIIQRAVLMPNMDVIGCGISVPNPSELMEKDKFAELMDQLRQDYDDIIIDSPPVRLVPDALIIARLCDVTLYVIRQGFTEKAELKFIQQMKERGQLPGMNIVFNGIQRLKYGYGYEYSNAYYNQIELKTGLRAMFSDFKNRF